MGAAGGNRHRQLMDACAQRGLRTAQIGDQRHHRHPGMPDRVGDHFRRIGHLRQQPGRHERRHFDFAQSRRDQRIDPPQLVRRRHGGLHRLQPVARSDFADQDVGGIWGVMRHACVSVMFYLIE
ncbi:hypothetical protein G6F46_014990 [Rhizopus delemar]|nr:hypothetical protein G6F46_014990 [Rhizopus delemar]